MTDVENWSQTGPPDTKRGGPIESYHALVSRMRTVLKQPFQIAAEQPIGTDAMLLNEGYDIPST